MSRFTLNPHQAGRERPLVAAQQLPRGEAEFTRRRPDILSWTYDRLRVAREPVPQIQTFRCADSLVYHAAPFLRGVGAHEETMDMSSVQSATMLDAAERVLRESGSNKAIRADEIVRRMLANGCSVADLTMNSLYSIVGST